MSTCRKFLSVATRPLTARFSHSGRPLSGIGSRAQSAPLNLRPGELVQVKTEKEILETLGADARCRGLALMPAMLAYCGKRLKVYKRVGHIMLENGGGLRTLKHTVLLEGAICEGKDVGCDRSCFFFWRESWLRRVVVPDQTEE